MNIDLQNLDWNKGNGLIPAIVQDANTHAVLMLAYMNASALQKTIESKLVTFYSRSKNRLWTKGETSGNHLKLVDIFVDCDQDSLLITVDPTGPACHNGTTSCFDAAPKPVISELEMLLVERERTRPAGSYTANLFNEGIKRMAQKVGEEGVEVALAAVTHDNNELCEEIADLIFHVLVLLTAKHLSFNAVLSILKNRKR